MRKIADLVRELLFHSVVYFLLAVLASLKLLDVHPTASALLLGGLGFALFGMWWRSRANGRRYPRGEVEALVDIRRDIESLKHGATVTVCGSGATAVIFLVTQIRDALRRGVSFEVLVLNPANSIVSMLKDIEKDLREKVIRPMVVMLENDADVRQHLGPHWCDAQVERLSQVGFDHEHLALIEISAAMWVEIATRLRQVDPRARSGSMRVMLYDSIPYLKCWRFKPASKDFYYIADQLFHPGVGVDNPMLRFERSASDDNELKARRLDALLEEFLDRSQPWPPGPPSKSSGA